MDTTEELQLVHKESTEVELTGEEHSKLSQIVHNELGSQYHSLMSLEKGCNVDIFNSTAYRVPMWNDSELPEYIFMITSVLSDHPEYSYFWRCLGDMYHSMYIKTRGNNTYYINAIQCYHKSILLGNIGCVDGLIRICRYLDSYDHGDVIPVMLELLHRSAASGNDRAAWNLIQIYDCGYFGVPIDNTVPV